MKGQSDSLQYDFDPMRITFKTEGGLAYFPGLSRPVVFDLDQLSADQSDLLRQQIHASGFFDLPSRVGTPRRGAADYHQYTLTVSDDNRSHTVRLFDPVTSAPLQSLLAILRQMAQPKP